MLASQVSTQLVAPGEADVLVYREDDESVQVALANREMGQAGTRQLKRIKIQSRIVGGIR